MTWTTVGLILGVAAAAWLAYQLGARGADRSARELEQVRHELARRLNELFSLQELSYLLSDSLKLERIVSQVARYVTRFVEAEGAIVVLADDTNSDRLQVVAAAGVLAHLSGTTLTTARAGLVGAVIGREQLEVLEAMPGAAPPQVGDIPLTRVAAVPFRAHGVTVGALGVVNRVGGAFNAEDLRLLSTVATHASIVLANARLFDLVREGKEQWETTFDALTDGIAVLDDTGCIRRANRAFALMFGRSLPTMIGVKLSSELLAGAPEFDALVRDAAKDRAPPVITIEGPPSAAPEAPRPVLQIAASPLRSGVLGPGWVVVLVEDVTEQKALQTQLIQNEKMVAVGQLVSGVAHELNNPLTSISGLSEFLLEQGGNDRNREHLRVIQEQAERAGQIVRNLLTFARKGAGDYGDVDLNDIARRTTLLMDYELRLREVVLETTLPPDLPRVRGDRYELQQVVLNLLTNAVHAVAENPPGRERRVIVSTQKVGSDVLLRVADSGSGIDPQHLKNLFTPFFTTKEPGEGTGLGLSISFGIAERHGGRLYAEPSGTGAAFVMSLPAAKGDGQEPRSRRSSGRLRAPDSDAPEAAPEPRSILLVDEDPAVQRMIRALFSKNGQVVSTPPNAGDAVNLLKTTRYDLIIADPRAAVSSGQMFADALLKKWPEHRGRTIFLTADVRPETDNWLRSMGCSYFQKPFKVSDLRSTVRRVMEHAGSAP